MLCIFLFAVLTSGCYSNSNQIEGEKGYLAQNGTVVALEENKILIVEGATIEDINNLTPKEIINKYDDGVWFSLGTDTPEGLDVGVIVRVSYNSLDTSLPAFGEAKEIKIIE
ncbi:YobA family protein [Bacillus sp. P14.5]|uniref:YobA family protein n=1 Tax=Bacillus sp. P14.5 TaxID=1983400 RepID=UPI000DEA33A0|nr:YobA family protein [Bacillus sp. P14.5]